MDYSPPEITESIGRVSFMWQGMELKVVADRLTDAGTAELWFYHHNGTGESLLHTAKANLLSTTTMTTLAKRMKEHSQDVPWVQVMTCISSKSLEYLRRGEPGTIIEPAPGQVKHPGYYVEPVIMKGVPNIIFGDKGVNKTTLALTTLGLIALGIDDSPIGLVASVSDKVALLDWESNRSLTEYTISRLIEGDTLPWFSLPYLRCKQSLFDEVDRIANFLHDNDIQVAMIDSLGQAAGSDKFDSAGKAAALRFFEALRQLNITSLIIAQNAKGEDNRKTIYGSTYFTYYARNIFELKGKRDDLNEDTMHIILSHVESNYSKKYKPMGFRIDYSDTSIKILPEAVSYADFYEKASQTKQLCEFLKDGAKSRKAIHMELNTADKQVDVILNRAKKKGLVISLGSGMWGLVSNNENT